MEIGSVGRLAARGVCDLCGVGVGAPQARRPPCDRIDSIDAPDGFPCRRRYGGSSEEQEEEQDDDKARGKGQQAQQAAWGHGWPPPIG